MSAQVPATAPTGRPEDVAPLSNIIIAEHFTLHKKHEGHVDSTCAWCVYDAHLDGDLQFLSKAADIFVKQTLAAMAAIKSRRS